MEVSQSIFSCVTLTSLPLTNFKMTKVPPLFKGFSQLVTCYLEYVELNEETFEMIFKLCRLLESLTVSQCELPSFFRIISSSLKFLALLSMDKIFLVEANCPELESIKILSCFNLGTVNLCLPLCVHLETDFYLLKGFSTIKSLKKITLSDYDCYFFFNVVKFLPSFPHLEELWIESTLLVWYPKASTSLLICIKSFCSKSYDLKSLFRNCFYLNHASIVQQDDSNRAS